jgi:hypothetical protein
MEPKSFVQLEVFSATMAAETVSCRDVTYDDTRACVAQGKIMAEHRWLLEFPETQWFILSPTATNYERSEVERLIPVNFSAE